MSLDESFVILPSEPPTSRAAEGRSTNDAQEQATDPYAHNWAPSVTGGIHIRGRHFVDAHGRVCNLRGVNLSGCTKTPVNHDHATFLDHPESVTFVGRPFPLAEADEHLSRLRRWGLTFIRFLVTWEAVEHAGPGQYDHEYLFYVRSILSLLPKYGMTCFVSLHQDVWSRYSGGSGAPAWTLERIGLDLQALEECGAAWLVGVRGGGHVEAERGIWPCGYQKLAAATMFTCFWAGDTFAPQLKIQTDAGEVPVQSFLQDAFLKMWDVVAKAVGDLPAVLGFEMLNEPHRGYIETGSLNNFVYETDLHLSYVPSALQSFALGAGHPTSVSHWTRSFPMPTRCTGSGELNPAGRSVWRKDGPTGGRCLWEEHMVWSWDKTKKHPVALRENYFVKHPMTGEKVDWYTDFYYPFLQRWAERVRGTATAGKIIFAEPIPNEFCPESWTPERRPADMVYAPHWYDLNALFAKAFGDFTVNVQGLSRGMFPLKAFYWGQRGVRDNYALQISNIVQAGYRSLGETPVIVGETGVPMDMNKGVAFKTGQWKWQSRMMDAVVDALERAMVGYTLWNYNPSNADAIGDDWNGENFSWFSSAEAKSGFSAQTAQELDAGGRLLRVIVRPYAAKTVGIPLHSTYEPMTGQFTFAWELSGGSEKKTTKLHTEIFMPDMIVRGRRLIINGLNPTDTWRHDPAMQTIFIDAQPTQAGERRRVTVTVDPPLEPIWTVNDWRSDFGAWIGGAGALIIAILVYWMSG